MLDTANSQWRVLLLLGAAVSGATLLSYGAIDSRSGAMLPSGLQHTQTLHTQVNIMGGGPEGYPQGYGGYGMQIPPVQARPGTSSFPFPSPASAPNAPAKAIDTSMFVRRSEEDTRFRLLESRLHVDEESMERMRDTIRRLKRRIDGRSEKRRIDGGSMDKKRRKSTNGGSVDRGREKK